MMPGCGGGGALLYVPLDLIRSWYALSICWLIWVVVEDAVLAIVAIGRSTEVERDALGNREWFSYN